MEYQDYYETLGVARDASADDIKKAYRRLARKYHPDVSSEADAEARFKAVNEAYEVLKDPEKRQTYDQLGAQWHAGDEFRPPPGFEQGFRSGSVNFGTRGGFGGAEFSDFFESLFGNLGGLGDVGRGAGFSNQAAAAPRAKVRIALEDSYAGGSRVLTLAEPGGGRRQLKVNIPKGICAGQCIRLAGQGGQGRDLLLEVEFDPHPSFRADGRDVVAVVAVAPWEVALGALVRAPTLGGPVDLKVPAGSQHGKRLRLKGRGLPGNPPGDAYVELKVEVPPPVNDAQRALYQQLADGIPFQR